MRLSLTVLAMMISMVSALPGDEPTTEIQFDIPEGWKSERIELPPSFAPDMELQGTEDVRFAPGMFQAKSDSFFSYIFVFQLQAKPKLTLEVLDRELLVYYRGLAKAVSKRRNPKLDTEQFSLQLKEAQKTVAKARDARGLKRYAGDLKWVEPFVTQKAQTLYLEVDTWANSKTGENYLFVCVSPQDKKAEIWKTMLELREKFLKTNLPKIPSLN